MSISGTLYASDVDSATSYSRWSLYGVDVGTGVDTIDSYAFADCYNMSGVYIPGTVSYIGEDAFSGCSSLSSITFDKLSDDVMNMMNYPWGLNNGTSLWCIDGVITVGNEDDCCDDAQYDTYFYTSNGSASTTIEGTLSFNSIISAMNMMGWSIIDLYQVDIGTGVTNIDMYAFQGCYSMTNIYIPSTVWDIGTNAFVGCYNLYNITYNKSTYEVEMMNYNDWGLPDGAMIYCTDGVVTVSSDDCCDDCCGDMYY